LLGRRTKAAVLVVALLVLAVEGVLLVRHYDRYYGFDAASGNAAGSAPAFERTIPERTTPERTAPRAPASPGEVPSKDDGAAFVHRATDGNSRGNYTYLSNPRTNGVPGAVVLVAPSPGRGGQADADYGHNVGVWYEFGKERWGIFNQDLAAIPAGSAFEVVVPPADQGFVHRAALPNIVGNVTYLDNPLTNGEPDAEVSVTQNWNPGGGAGVYNDHSVGVFYDEDAQKWFVYNEDETRMPEGAAFNVAVSGETG
jgi:hypothetical protein